MAEKYRTMPSSLDAEGESEGAWRGGEGGRESERGRKGEREHARGEKMSLVDCLARVCVCAPLGFTFLSPTVPRSGASIECAFLVMSPLRWV